VFSFALMFANDCLTACDGFYDASACWLSHMKQETIDHWPLTIHVFKTALCELASMSNYRKTSISPPWRSIFQPFLYSDVILDVTFY